MATLTWLATSGNCTRRKCEVMIARKRRKVTRVMRMEMMTTMRHRIAKVKSG
jgi:hypothetical protein